MNLVVFCSVQSKWCKSIKKKIIIILSNTKFLMTFYFKLKSLLKFINIKYIIICCKLYLLLSTSKSVTNKI